MPCSKLEERSETLFGRLYRSFIPNAANLVEPLQLLLRKRIEFDWGEDQIEAFGRVKEELANLPSLAPPHNLERSLWFTLMPQTPELEEWLNKMKLPFFITQGYYLTQSWITSTVLQRRSILQFMRSYGSIESSYLDLPSQSSQITKLSLSLSLVWILRITIPEMVGEN